jgi:hypothetical protein
MVQDGPNYGGSRQVCRVGPVLESRPNDAVSAQWCKEAPVMQDRPNEAGRASGARRPRDAERRQCGRAAAMMRNMRRPVECGTVLI